MPTPAASAPRLVGTSSLLIAGFLALLGALAIGGAAASLLIDDPGPAVRFGLPAAKLVVDLAVSVTVGALALVVLALSGDRETGRAMDLAAAAAAVWTVASALAGLLTFVSATGVPFSFSPTFGAQLGFFLTSIGAGEAWLVSTLIAASVTVLCFAVRSRPALVLVLLLAVAGLLPMAGEGHTAGASSHDEAVAALALHLIFAAVWLGGLLALVYLRGILSGSSLTAVIGRYSSLALVCFGVVALSGYVSASLRIGSLDQLTRPYGTLVIVKAVALLGLGVAGAIHRRFALRRLRAGRAGWFWALVLGELVVMGVAVGTAAGLARTAPPVAETPLDATSPSVILTDEPLPPPLDLLRLLTEGRLDLVWLVAACVAAAYYLAGVIRLRRRGERWPASRTASWLAGLLLLVVITNGGAAAYARHLFSAEMMTVGGVAVLVPLLLVPAAPLRLLARAAEPRTDGSQGVREWVELYARPLRRLGGWLPAAVVGVLSAWVFVFTPVLRWIVTDAAGREAGIALLLAAGLVVVSAVLRSPSRRTGALVAGLTAVAWALSGLVLLTGSGLLLADWYGAMGWSTPAIDDQRAGGAVLLAAAALPHAVLAVVQLAGRRSSPSPEPVRRTDEDRWRAVTDRALSRRGH